MFNFFELQNSFISSNWCHFCIFIETRWAQLKFFLDAANRVAFVGERQLLDRIAQLGRLRWLLELVAQFSQRYCDACQTYVRPLDRMQPLVSGLATQNDQRQALQRQQDADFSQLVGRVVWRDKRQIRVLDEIDSDQTLAPQPRVVNMSVYAS